MSIYALSCKAIQKQGMRRCPSCGQLCMPAARVMPEGLYLCESCAISLNPALELEGSPPKWLDTGSTDWVLEFLESAGRQCSISEIQRASPYSDATIRNVLVQLCKERACDRTSYGVYVSTGKGRSNSHEPYNPPAKAKKLILEKLQDVRLTVAEIHSELDCDGHTFTVEHIRTSAEELRLEGLISRTESKPYNYFLAKENHGA